MKFRYVVTVDSPSAPPQDREVWQGLLKGVSKDQSKVFIIVQPVEKVWFTLLGGGPIRIHEGSSDDVPLPVVPPTALRCGHCGELVTAEQAWGHKCGSKSARPWLMRKLIFGVFTPLDVVLLLGGVGIGRLVGWMLLKR